MNNIKAMYREAHQWQSAESTARDIDRGVPTELAETVNRACSRIPPLWPLKNFVAVNPFLGMVGQEFGQVCETMHKVTHGDILMPAQFYQSQLESNIITDGDLAQAASLSKGKGDLAWSPEGLKSALQTLIDKQGLPPMDTVKTWADFLDEAHGTSWSNFIADEISKWCAAYFDEGQSAWRMPWRSLPLYDAWRQAAAHDRTPEIQGIKGFRKLVQQLPSEPLAVIEWVLDDFGIPNNKLEDFLHRQLMSVAGWSAFVQHRVRDELMQGKQSDTLVHLLAIRLTYDYTLASSSGHKAYSTVWKNGLASNQAAVIWERQRLEVLRLFQLAYEIAGQRKLLGQISHRVSVARAESQPVLRKSVQAVFCIDVRSEVFRRALETVSPRAETFGFAGFFGFPIEYIPLGHDQGTAQCPVLLKPQFRIRETVSEATVSDIQEILDKRLFRKSLGKLWKSFKTSAVSCFPYVEVAGLLFGIKLLTDSLGLTRTVVKPGAAGLDQMVIRRIGPLITRQRGRLVAKGPVVETGIALGERIELARKALKGMGLTADFARIVLLCGHGSSTVNNPYGSSLDCGACGGHTGEANARVAAKVLNDWEVRAGLIAQGIAIPHDTWFLAAQHDTTTDEVRLFDTGQIPETHAGDLMQLSHWLKGAAQLARQERAFKLGLGSLPPAAVEKAVKDRSQDWSQVRPEWGLAGNAAFIAAPRELTRGVCLDGKVFLHNYEHKKDADGSILELIMTAPMVVASWINLQYYASTVNNRVFGSGNKVIHNVVGTFGVLQGNGGDLQVGLPQQSLHDGKQWLHEPLRLSVFIQAPLQAIESVMAKHESVRQLVENQWLHLFAIGDEGKTYHRYLRNGQWLAED